MLQSCDCKSIVNFLGPSFDRISSARAIGMPTISRFLIAFFCSCLSYKSLAMNTAREFNATAMRVGSSNARRSPDDS